MPHTCAPAIGDANRIAFLGGVARNVGDGHVAVYDRRGADRFDDRVRDGTRVKRLGPLLGDGLQSRRIFGVFERRADRAHGLPSPS